MIFRNLLKRRKPDVQAANGMSVEQVDQFNQSIAAGANAIPVAGQAISAGLSITSMASKAVIGDGSNEKNNAIGNMLNPLHSVNALMTGRAKEAIPIYGQLKAAQRMKREYEEKYKKAEEEKTALAREDSARQYNGMAPKFSLYRKGGSLKQAVILGGNTHEQGGNAILDAKTGEKVAETEVAELLFTHDQTKRIESLVASYDADANQNHLYELGKLVQETILFNTKDNSGKFNL